MSFGWTMGEVDADSSVFLDDFRCMIEAIELAPRVEVCSTLVFFFSYYLTFLSSVLLSPHLSYSHHICTTLTIFLLFFFFFLLISSLVSSVYYRAMLFLFSFLFVFFFRLFPPSLIVSTLIR